ncbi:psbP domain-containing protein 6, chloroplastic isoform X2 [Andrographis paniculata]|uniref:psbP domain-containing protein 6, chloroplastic isoform X2 n=1 Tax=Andrographis paniculata TaxID=175694 RepID=UPI0021E72EFD|nr:psbP domain-containing protein 6, chloroplastic isoform X2 [Andrographis paniculata]
MAALCWSLSAILSASRIRITSSSSSSSSSSPKSNQNFGKHKVDSWSLSRREFVNGSVAALNLVPVLVYPQTSVAREVEVGSYLPPSPTDPSFVLFTATSKDTPALRAGNVEPYKFILPPTWKQMRVANILSGNYCQPKCAEPWVEVKFEDERQGKVQVVASPLIRLTNKPNATIQDIGSPEKVIASLGPFVTGNTYDADELVHTSVQKQGDQTVLLQVRARNTIRSDRIAQSCQGDGEREQCYPLRGERNR